MAQERPIPAPRNAPVLPKKKKASVTAKGFNIIFLSPSSVVYNKHEPVVAVFNQSLPSNVDFTIKFLGMRTSTKSTCNAQKIGDNVLTFRAPEHYPPEDTELTIHHGNHLTKLCSYECFSFKTCLQQIRETLIRAGDPIEFMCAALQLKQKNSVALDFELERQFLKNQPPNFELLASDPKKRIQEKYVFEANPTLLHFASRYNLIKLAVAILKCPGGYNALNICNIDGLNPSQIASDCGHENLSDVLADAQQCHNITIDATDIYVSLDDPIYDTYVTLVGNAEGDDVYVAMDRADEEIYESMVNYPGESEELYQNASECSFNMERDPYNGASRAAETTSLFSVSSTSSSESNASSGSGSSARPKMPAPRAESCDERALQDQLRCINEELSERTPRMQREDRHSLPNRGLYSEQTRHGGRPHSKTLPPIPGRSPNVNY